MKHLMVDENVIEKYKGKSERQIRKGREQVKKRVIIYLREANE
jgi:hypothetical protein